jgi:hypothetical protein
MCETATKHVQQPTMSDKSRENSTPSASPKVEINENHEERDLEAGVDEPLLASNEPSVKQQPPAASLVSMEEPMLPKDYTPIRTDPIEGIDQKSIKRRLDRHVNEQVPEIHIIGRIAWGQHLVNDVTEGTFCR